MRVVCTRGRTGTKVNFKHVLGRLTDSDLTVPVYIVPTYNARYNIMYLLMSADDEI